ncbi:MAG: hypothetical protein WCF30_19815 [Terracidiphilus sp.]
MMSLIHPSSSTAAPDTLARRIMQDAHLRDGLPEIVVGGILLLAAAQSYTMATLLHGGPLVLKRILILVWTFLVIALTFSTCSIPGAPGTGWLLRWLRRRYLISRYGYVKPRLEWNKRQLALYGGIGLLVVAALLIARREVAPPLLDRGLFIAIGVFVGGIEALVGRSLRFRAMGLLTIACGTLVAFLQLSLELRFAALYAFTGAMALVSGVIVLAHFLRANAEKE